MVAIIVSPSNDRALLDLDPDNSSAAGGPNYATTFSEGGAPVPIADTDVSVFDTDNLFLASATITLTNHQQGDLLSVGVLPPGITASSYDPATGVLTLSGTNATQADFASALQAVTFSSTSPDPIPVDRIVNVVVNDGAANSNGANTFIHVLPVNTAPTLDLDANNSTAAGRAYHATFTAGTAPVPVADGDVLITDIDNTTLTSATIRLVNLKPDDVLSVNGTLPGLISTIGYDAATGTLTLTGAATLADYQSALHQIEFSNTSLTPDLTTRQLAITSMTARRTARRLPPSSACSTSRPRSISMPTTPPPRNRLRHEFHRRRRCGRNRRHRCDDLRVRPDLLRHHHAHEPTGRRSSLRERDTAARNCGNRLRYEHGRAAAPRRRGRLACRFSNGAPAGQLQEHERQSGD
jgi:hypothetical protein